ncbi:MAG: thrombospondin type 3 repeat-containing protein, partial [Myxococcota bacterium]
FVLPSIQATAWAQDTDGDGVPDTADNCRTLPNAGASACDTDADGYGNACDGDFNQDGATDGADFVDYFLPDFLSGVDRGIGSDMDCDGAVTGIDFATHFIANFSEGTPGPGRAPGASAMSPFGGNQEQWTEPDSESIHEVDPGVALSTSPRAGEEIELDLFEARLRRKQEVERWIDRVADAVVNRMSEEPARGGGLFGDTGHEFTEDPADQFIEEESADEELLGVSTEALVDELPPLEEAVRERVSTIIEETPTDLELSPTSATLFSIADLGRALVGLTVLESPAIGLRDPWGERCETTVLRDVDTSSGRATLRRSPLIDFFEDVARPDDRRAMSRAVFALSRVQAGIRCLNGADLSALESAYARALTELLLRLRDGGRELAARAIWDHSLPVSLLFFDAVKAYKKPGTLALLRLPSDFWDSVSTIDDSAALPEMAFADTLAHRLYCVSPSDSLTLDRFGIWAPDWTADGQLQRIAGHIDGHTAWPCDILRSFTELERLGEGDCPLVEMVQTNMICRSPRTCDAKLRVRAEAAGSSGGLFGGFGPADPFGIGPEGSGAAAPSLVGAPTRPGMPGSRYSHLGTDRSSYSDDVCSTSAADTGGAGPTDCLGPPIRNSRGSFSRDP